MPSLGETQAAFAHALHDPSKSPPEIIMRRAPAQPVRRFNVYRNTVYAGLTGVITARYPAVQNLMGEEIFQAAARLFVTEHPPTSPVLLEYGDGFTDFLASLELIDDMPHVFDIARLEWSMHQARNAADTIPLDAQALATLEPERTVDLTFTFAPSCFLLASEHVVFSLWHSTVAEEPINFPERGARGEQVLISRRGLEAEAVRLPHGAYTFIAELMRGASLGEAAAHALAEFPAVPLDRVMALLIRQEALASFQFQKRCTERSP